MLNVDIDICVTYYHCACQDQLYIHQNIFINVVHAIEVVNEQKFENIVVSCHNGERDQGNPSKANARYFKIIDKRF